MKLNAIVTLIYAILLAVGGTIGYATAHSIASLAMGMIFAVLLGICAWGMYKDCKYSYYSTLFLTTLLLCFFSYRFLASYKFMPSGMMALISLGVLIILLFNSKKTQRIS